MTSAQSWVSGKGIHIPRKSSRFPQVAVNIAKARWCTLGFAIILSPLFHVKRRANADATAAPMIA